MTELTGYNIGALSRRSGVPAATLRAWERRYGVPSPGRTVTGRRVYSDEDLTAILRMRQLVAEGFSPARAAILLRGDGVTDQHTIPVARIAQGFAERFVDACLNYDDLTANRVLDEVMAVYPIEQACQEVIVPALTRIGDLWRSDALPVATEHLASNLVRDRLAVLSRVSSVSPNGPVAVLACAPGEMHDIGPLMLALFLRRRGWRVLTLGSNTPIDELSRVILALKPTVVVVSATHANVARSTYTRCQSLSSQLVANGTVLAFGGPGFRDIKKDPDSRAVITLAQDLVLAVDQLEDLTVGISNE
jgi:DNA-binding transcriptional MerR regulator